MGYSTSFAGELDLDRPLSAAHKTYLSVFSRTRRTQWDASQVQYMPDPVREAVDLPVGREGGYFVGYEYDGNGDEPPFLIDDNEPPEGQPSLWCCWTPNEDGTKLIWNGQEKFYFYCEWLEYIIDNFLQPWGYLIYGKIMWTGEDALDT